MNIMPDFLGRLVLELKKPIPRERGEFIKPTWQLAICHQPTGCLKMWEPNRDGNFMLPDHFWQACFTGPVLIIRENQIPAHGRQSELKKDWLINVVFQKIFIIT